ncbi:MAG: TrmH family RNA methyltransferase [Rhodobacter sp.]|nr:TrmH family RNA methyltransferase [Rhodobacter sp.]
MIVLLCGTQSPVNIGMILRSAEAFEAKVVIVDTFATLADQGARRRVSDFACGAFERLSPPVWQDYSGLDGLGGRRITAVAGGIGTPVDGFAWREDDILLIGNEYDGIPPLLADRADASIVIPMSRRHNPKPPSHRPIDASRVTQIANPGAPALNAAVAASIILSHAFAKRLETV